MNDYHDNRDLSSLQLEKLESVVGINENQSNNETPFPECFWINQNIKNKTTIYKESLPAIYTLSVINNQDYSLFNNIIQSYDDPNERLFNPREWLIVDSLSRRLRAPRQNEFLYHLLEHPCYASYLTWLNRNEGLFKIHDPERVAKLWSRVKNRRTNGVMTYDKFARALRFYYKSGSMIKTHKKHTFRFRLPLHCAY
ncbi:unnamed protein product [Rotaria magnacalcarata]|nr:unnamed protein product [Rotaria magnacalcarata]CAF1348492.1 unnamed protein product [Rotaria magnacalcarata]CAF3827570.1 unnamed protein product [Rotaria magnacalcarata]CAF4313923.1 unnamed protein product [Rotaria magnacalcarata]